MKLLGISGSLRKGSLNRKLMHQAIRLFGDAKVTIADLNLPLYDGDLEEEQGIPDSVTLLANQIAAADAVIVSCPEYNQGISGVMKNALDWVSRTDGSPWANKPVALLAAAAGRAGGARSNYALRLAMAPFNTNLLQGPEILVAGAHNEFDENDQLTSEFYTKSLTKLMTELREISKS
ncbi:NADPH-dependent FMN reductase [Amylibacter kogurei]|uniref:NADPH-dependent FMN reductase n=1 Tax=Paramylibacter kogurei TaxID=1889778 RepID=A0A2G5K005_9RHOB|nr:NAD(P)H-dependent oxidoreductase [Amylibacter kogurei]PIB22858.1 NADPH-dependent FMN reductase [Amylibacter kogurei]